MSDTTAFTGEETKVSKLGIIAGQGRLPLLIAESYRSAKKPYFVVGIEGLVLDADITSFEHGWTQLGTMGNTYKVLQAEDCVDVVMAGRVHRPNFKNLKVDRAGATLVAKILKIFRRGDDAIMKLVVDAFEEEGFRIVGINDVLSELIMEEGALGQIRPADEHSEDIRYAVEVVQQIGQLDIGQGAVVRHQHVLAVEAVEGTDAMLERCAGFSRDQSRSTEKRSGVFVKMPKPEQERRVDLPVIGVRTVKKAAEAGLAGIACAAGGVLVIDRDAVGRAADDYGMFVFGFPYDRTTK